jgi:hypothetical protein
MKCPPPDAPEWQLQLYVKQEIQKLGLIVAEVNYTRGSNPASKAHTEPGFPDLVVIGRRQAHLWELKTLTGRLTPSQEKFHRRCAEAGYHIPVIRSLDDALLYYQAQWGKR